MTHSEQIIILTNKNKIIGQIFICAAFITLGLWQLTDGNSSYFKYFIAGLLLLVFGSFLVFWLFRIADKRPGVIINGAGITDNATSVSLGEISWTDIDNFRTTQVWSKKFITIILHDPQKFIDGQTNSLKRKILIANFKKNGSPFNIPTNILLIDPTTLKQILESKLKEYQTIHPI